MVPIPFDLNDAEVDLYFRNLNGLLLTGGELVLNFTCTYLKTAKAFFDRATASKEVYFPIWGTCEGFQLLSILAANDDKVLLSGYHAQDVSWPIQFTQEANKTRYYNQLPEQVKKTLATTNSVNFCSISTFLFQN